MKPSGFEVTVGTTSLSVYPGEESFSLLQPLLNLMTYEDEYVEETRTLGFIYDSKSDILHFHRGVDLNYLRRLLGDVSFKMREPHETENIKFNYEEIVSPRNNDQVDVIDFVSGNRGHANNIEANQLFLVKKPGFGKTYCSGVGLCKYGVKTLIITHRDSLRNQWMESLYNMCGMNERYVHEITSSEELYDIAHNQHGFDYDVYLITHARFRAGLKRIGDMNTAKNIGENLKIGLKIIDEAHLEFRNILLMDSVFNVKRNLYLTATDGRSNKDENSIFKHAFSNAVYYKPSSLLENNLPTKWVEYNSVEINSYCKPYIYKFRVAGGRGMNPATYGKWVIQYDKAKTHLKCCRDILKEIYERDDKAKVLIFMPLIDLCEESAYYFTMELSYDESFQFDLSIKTINSHNSKRENDMNKRADVIVTTIGSCGTGTDIPGITDIISCSPFVSSITAEQVFGRIRYCGKVCHYYDIYDVSVQMDRFWFKSRSRKLKQLALNVKERSWVDEDRGKE